MIDDADIIRLRDTYEQLSREEILFKFGPIYGYTKQSSAQEFWNTTIGPAVAYVQQSQHEEAAGAYVVDAPSPWHAYFYLRAQHQAIYRGHRPLGADASTIGSGQVGEHLFFRGQRCADWSFGSSLRRRDAVARDAERRATAALAHYFWTYFAAEGDIAKNSAICFAQHYGIATDFVDISCDPDVAVWFATHPAGEACPSGNANAVVRAVSWAVQESGAAIRALLPPPFVRNVYTQRGLFIDTVPTRGEFTGKLTLDVRFPRQTAGGEFRLIRDGQVVDVWPPLDVHELELVTWARAVAAACRTEQEVLERVEDQRQKGELPTFWLERELSDFEGHVEGWLKILDWVLPATCVTALPVSGAQGPMRYEILPAKVRGLVQANPTLFKAFASASQTSNFKGFELRQQILAIAHEELGLPGPAPGPPKPTN